jgi:hypothetical protein
MLTEKEKIGNGWVKSTGTPWVSYGVEYPRVEITDKTNKTMLITFFSPWQTLEDIDENGWLDLEDCFSYLTSKDSWADWGLTYGDRVCITWLRNLIPSKAIC